MPDFLDWLEAADAVALRDQLITSMLGHHDAKLHKMDQEPFPAPTPEHLLAHPDHLVEYKQRLYGDEHPIDEGLVRDVHAMYTKPTSMKALMLHHLHDMWNNFIAKEWERNEPQLRACVDAFSRVNFSGMSALEIARSVTGRDFAGNIFLSQEVRDVNELIFIPSMHLGPFVTMGRMGETVVVVFRMRMPDGLPNQVTRMDRSDLLVRLGALADDTRMQIMNLLVDHEELCAPQVIKLLGLSQSAASRHLRQLTATGFLTERRHEGAKCYSLNHRRVDETIQALQDQLR